MKSCCEGKEDGKKSKLIPWFKKGSSKECNSSRENIEDANKECLMEISEETTTVTEPPDGGFWVR